MNGNEREVVRERRKAEVIWRERWEGKCELKESDLLRSMEMGWQEIRREEDWKEGL